jgi:hypothetical protein
MNSFTYLLIGYGFGALIGSGMTFLAMRIHIRQHYFKRIRHIA